MKLLFWCLNYLVYTMVLYAMKETNLAMVIHRELRWYADFRNPAAMIIILWSAWFWLSFVADIIIKTVSRLRNSSWKNKCNTSLSELLVDRNNKWNNPSFKNWYHLLDNVYHWGYFFFVSYTSVVVLIFYLIRKIMKRRRSIYRQMPSSTHLHALDSLPWYHVTD